MDIFGNYISKCIRLSENVGHVKDIEVLYRLRYKQKYYFISSETTCRMIRGVSEGLAWLVWFRVSQIFVL